MCAAMTAILSSSSTLQLVCRACMLLFILFSLPHSIPPPPPSLPGNPVLIPSSLVKGLKQGSRADLASLTVFASGNPQPTGQDYSWYFNDEPLFIGGAEVPGEQEYFSVKFNTIVLQPVIVSSIGGVYRSVVNTSAGEVTATIVLNVECEWSNLTVINTCV